MSRSQQSHLKTDFLFPSTAGVVLVSTVFAWAGAPVTPQFTYQGHIKVNGVALNDTCRFRFTLWDAPIGGTQIGAAIDFDGSAGFPAITVVNGFFAVHLNNNNQFGPDAFSGEARWLQIGVACAPPPVNYTTLTPRQPLTATPYALGIKLPYSGSFAGSDETVISVEQTGLGYAASFNALDSGNYYGALQASAAGAGPGVFATNSGGGSVARLQNVVQDNVFPTLHATTRGPAFAVQGDAQSGTNGGGVNGIGQGTGDGIRGTAAGTGYAGRFNGSVFAETSNWAMRGVKTGNGTFPGVWGETHSGSNDASGVRGYVNDTTPGSGSAGVHGHNFGTTSNGYGVKGTHSGSGAGVYGKANALGGTGIRAEGPATTGIAIEIRSGGIRVPGAGANTSTPVFIHVADSSNSHSAGSACDSLGCYCESTRIDHPLCNGDPTAILFVQVNGQAGSTPHETIVQRIEYDATENRWWIRTPDDTNNRFCHGQKFNVMIIKP